ncbi:MAG: hypothetical protein KAG53_01080 [Endozoicomonadaceae bacterium]|nr:hypothetical protein [Endozoicomonadaceae bacterium]
MARLIHFCNVDECFNLLLNKHLNKNNAGNSFINDRSVRTCGDFRVVHDDLLTVLNNASGSDGNVLVIPGPSLNSWPTIESGTALDILKKNMPNQDLESLMKQNKPKKGEVSVIHIKGHNEMNINKIVVIPIDSNKETDETLRRLYLDAVVKLRTDQDVGRQIYLVPPCADGKKASDIDQRRPNGRWICRQMAGALGANDKVTVVKSANANKQTEATMEYYVDSIPDDTTAPFLVDGKWEKKATIQHSGYLKSIYFGRSGKYLVTASADQTVKICELDRGKWQEKATLNHPGVVRKAIFSPNEDRLVTACVNDGIRIYGRVNGEWQEEATIQTNIDVLDVIFSPNGKQLIIALDNQSAKIFELAGEKWQEKAIIQNSGWISTNSISVSPDEKHLIIIPCSNIAQLWGLVEGKWCNQGAIRHDFWINTACFSPNGKYLVTASDDRTAQIWEIGQEGWKKKATIQHDHVVGSASFSPDGKRIVTGTDDGMIRILKLVGEEWQEETTFDNCTYKGMKRMNLGFASFSPAGHHIVAVDESNSAGVWEFVGEEWKKQATIKHSSRISAAIFSLNGKRIVTVSDSDGMAKTSNISAAIVSIDGERIVTVSDSDGMTKTLELVGNQWKEKATFTCVESEEYVGSSPTGDYIVTASNGHKVNIWG